MTITIELRCPRCNDNNLARNGKKRNGVQNYLWNACGRQFIRDDQRTYIGTLLCVTGLIKIMLARGCGEKWDAKYPMISQSWERHWNDLSEFFKYPPEIRRAIYTTNAVESLNYQLRKVTKNRSTFCTDDAILKILYLAIRNASKKWTMPVKEWGQALNQFAIEFGKERVPF